MRHVTVFAERGTYAGWPANHGAWQWGNEMLVGFLTGERRAKSMHNIAEPFSHRQARSLDGGETWRLEETGIPDMMPEPTITKHGLSLSGKHIIRVRGCYDHGGDYVPSNGGYYASVDRGKTWEGPYCFTGLDFHAQGCINTSRTRYDSASETLFLSDAAMGEWGTDRVLCVVNENGTFKVTGILQDKGRVVMPAYARIQETVFLACRRRGNGRREGWIDLYASQDYKTWKLTSEVGRTGGHNGNPPALIVATGGQLVCCYAQRSERRMVARVSADAGGTWGEPLTLRAGECSDIGYPQLFKRDDGKLVCVYYWAAVNSDHQSIEATIF